MQVTTQNESPLSGAVHFRRARIERMRIGISRVVSDKLLEAGAYGPTADMQVVAEDLGRDIAFHLKTFIAAGNETEQVIGTKRVPLTWWDHLKLEKFPKWLLDRFPARMYPIETVVKRVHVCPHNNPFNGDHVNFLDVMVAEDLES